MKKIISIHLAAGMILIPFVNAFAYLDPGTGSMILQSLLAGFMIIGSGLAIFRNKLKTFFKRLFKKEKKYQ